MPGGVAQGRIENLLLISKQQHAILYHTHIILYTCLRNPLSFCVLPVLYYGGLGYVQYKKKKYPESSPRIELKPSSIKSCMVTVCLYFQRYIFLYYTIICHGPRQPHDRSHIHDASTAASNNRTAAEEREMVVPDDGCKPAAMKQPLINSHSSIRWIRHSHVCCLCF